MSDYEVDDILEELVAWVPDVLPIDGAGVLVSPRSLRERSRRAFKLCVDLDGFKGVNDRFGHAGGDRVLAEVASRLRNCVRPSDTPARIGDDEFAVVCDELGAAHEAISVAERILAALQEPISIDDTSITVTPSIGVATGNGTDSDATTLIADADAAMYRAEQNGRNRIELFAS